MIRFVLVLCAAFVMTGCASNQWLNDTFGQTEQTTNEQLDSRSANSQSNQSDKPCPSCPEITCEKESGVFAEAFELSNGYSITIEEGRLEPRSIGSMAVKLYRDLEVGDFLSAFHLARDGTITQVELVESEFYDYQIDITTVTAGSGSYTETQSVCVDGAVIKICMR
ncbi:PliI family lysozyme inhibitor of I-type lysozyme [Shewanella maritima]|uniref:PliI family lysozyme inhibitor of I-type lysozyme n=1 Tax=Shewanella maritima TaxID=2520507 RepID=UPI003735521B